MASKLDEIKLVSAVRAMIPVIRASSDAAWDRPPAVRVLDCLLSLNRNYDRFVVPRLDNFERAYPNTKMVRELQTLISQFPSSHCFVLKVLNYRHEARAVTLRAVVDWLVDISGDGPEEAQLQRLEQWAAKAKPQDHLQLGIRGFGLAGFQYLRMLFGANTTKPDVHIVGFVEKCVGRRISNVRALELLEQAAATVGTRLRDLDTTIWEHSARGLAHTQH